MWNMPRAYIGGQCAYTCDENCFPLEWGLQFSQQKLTLLWEMGDEISFVPSNRGDQLLLLHGHLLSINKNGKRYWKCKKVADCRITATTGDYLVNHHSEHAHAPNEALAKVKLLTHRAKETAKNQPTRHMRRIFNEVFRNVDLDDERNIDHLPNLKNIKNSMYLSRTSRLPRIPHSRVELQLEGRWRRTIDGRDIFLYRKHCIQLCNGLLSEVNLVRNNVYIVTLYSVTQSAFIWCRPHVRPALCTPYTFVIWHSVAHGHHTAIGRLRKHIRASSDWCLRRRWGMECKSSHTRSA